jgi:hypothetical protein
VLDLGRHRDYADVPSAASADRLLSADFSVCAPAGLSA